WESSSTISASLSGGKFNSAIDWRISALKSGIFNSGDSPNRFYKFAPAVTTGRQDLFAGARKSIISPLTLPGLFQPTATDPSPRLQSVEQRVKRRNAEPQGASRAQFDQLPDFISVARPVLQQRQNQQLGASLLQLAVRELNCHMLLLHISAQ